MPQATHVAIVGAGHAGGRVVQHLRSLGFAGQITLIGDEIHAPYERPPLSKEILLDQQEIHSLILGPHEFWSEADACTRIHGQVTQVHPGARRLTVNHEQEVSFDTLVIATGGRPRKPGIPGADLPGVHTLRTIDDSLALKSQFAPGRRLVVMGGGVIGMEVASSAVAKGMQVTVLERGDRIMRRCLPREGADWLAQVHDRNAVAIRTEVQVTAIEPVVGSNALTVHIADAHDQASCIEADLVLLAIGIECELSFLEGSGIATGDGVIVDEQCRAPGMPWVYAVGDVANTPNPYLSSRFRQETWRNAENQAAAVAEFIMGARSEPFVELPWMWTDQHGFNIQVVGVPLEGDRAVMGGSLENGTGSLLWLRDGVVAGGMLVNNGRERKALEQLVQRAVAINPADLESGARLRLKDLL